MNDCFEKEAFWWVFFEVERDEVGPVEDSFGFVLVLLELEIYCYYFYLVGSFLLPITFFTPVFVLLLYIPMSPGTTVTIPQPTTLFIAYT